MNGKTESLVASFDEWSKLLLVVLFLLVFMVLLPLAYSFEVYTECREMERSRVACAHRAISSEPVSDLRRLDVTE